MNIPERILSDKRLGLTAKLLLAVIEDRAQGATVRMRMIDLAKIVGCSVCAVSRHLRDLEQLGLITARQGKRSTAKEYEVNA